MKNKNKNKNKSEVKGKPKYPLFKSMGEIILLILFIAIASTGLSEVTSILFTNPIMSIMYNIEDLVFLVIGLGGSVLILVDNFAGKQIIKGIFKKIWNFYRHFKVYWKQHVAIIIVLSGLIIYSQIAKYNNSTKLCGSDGDIYYCETQEKVACEDDLIPVFDNKTYQCVTHDTYLHDYEHKEYTYICTKKYGDENSELNEELLKAEKECLYNEIITEAETVVADIKKDLPSSYDVRNKVTIKAGNQGNSNTCSLWSETKALEISAQLKGIDYQFLLDFEKQINDIKTLSPATEGTSENLCYGDECIPGKKKSINISEFGLTTSDIDSQENKYYPEFSDEFKKYRNAYLLLPDGYDIYNDSNFILNSDEYFNIMTKYIIMKYGSSFILTTDENKYIDPVIGHQMTIIGWDDSRQSWLALNSWGDTWANTQSNGYLKSNGDGTTWIKYSDKGWDARNGAIELISQ